MRGVRKSLPSALSFFVSSFLTLLLFAFEESRPGHAERVGKGQGTNGISAGGMVNETPNMRGHCAGNRGSEAAATRHDSHQVLPGLPARSRRESSARSARASRNMCLLVGVVTFCICGACTPSLSRASCVDFQMI